MPDQKDAKRQREQLHRLEEESGRLQGQVELLTSRYREANAESITLQRKLYDALGQLGQEQRGREQAEARCEELRAERDEARDEMERRGARWLHENEALRCTNTELHRQLAEMASARDRAQHGYEQEHRLRLDAEQTVLAVVKERDEARREVLDLRTFSIGPDGMRLGPLQDTSCTGRAPAKVGPSSFTMRGCRLAEGHAGPCEA